MNGELEDTIKKIKKAIEDRYGTDENPPKNSFDNPRLVRVAAGIINLAKKEKLTIIELKSLSEMVDIYLDSIRI